MSSKDPKMVNTLVDFAIKTKRLLLRLSQTIARADMRFVFQHNERCTQIEPLIAALPDSRTELRRQGKPLLGSSTDRIVIEMDRSALFELWVVEPWNFELRTPQGWSGPQEFIEDRLESLRELKVLLELLLDDRPFADLLTLATRYFELTADRGLRFSALFGDQKLYDVRWDGAILAVELCDPRTYLDLATLVLKGRRATSLRKFSVADLYEMIGSVSERIQEAAEHIEQLGWTFQVVCRERMILRAGAGVSSNLAQMFGPLELHLDALFELVNAP
ncbi:MAG: hypothetical protein P9M14_05395 [Candidatus Alcyoniella australis]|nr:hypothetical protein [Candidatus Alcyoniella australis]